MAEVLDLQTLENEDAPSTELQTDGSGVSYNC